jgi:hypothetical protein
VTVSAIKGRIVFVAGWSASCLLPALRSSCQGSGICRLLGSFLGVWLCVWHTVAAWQAGLVSPCGYLSWVVCVHPWLWFRVCAGLCQHIYHSRCLLVES